MRREKFPIWKTKRGIKTEGAEEEHREHRGGETQEGGASSAPTKAGKPQEHRPFDFAQDRQECLCHVCLRERLGIWYATAHEKAIFD